MSGAAARFTRHDMGVLQPSSSTTRWNSRRFFAGAARSRRGRGGSSKGKSKGRGRGRRRGKGRVGGQSVDKPTPPLSRVMRMFVARVHPDKFVYYPEEQQVNEESLSQLTGFMSNVSNPDEEFMPAQKIAMHFWVIETVDDDNDGNGTETETETETLRKVEFALRTTGGDCKNLVQRQLEDLFRSVGIEDPTFEWDDKFWQSDTKLKPQDFDDDDDDAKKEGKEDGETSSRNKKAPPMSIDEILQNLDPVLQAIAAVPWLQPNDRIAVFVKEKAFSDLEAQGWRNLKPAATVSLWDPSTMFGCCWFLLVVGCCWPWVVGCWLCVVCCWFLVVGWGLLSCVPQGDMPR